MPGLSVIVPCLNEAANLRALVERVRPALHGPSVPAGDAELILVDDGSIDDSWSRMQHLGSEFSDVRAARHRRTQGIPAAWRTGLAVAHGDWICVLDADLQYSPEEIPRLWALLRESGADIAQGARAHVDRRRNLRFILSRGLSGLLNRTFYMSLRDNKSGFFMCHRRVLTELLGFRGHYRHWQCLVMVAAHHHGFRIREVETPFSPRRAGRSAFGWLPLGPAAAVAFDLVTALREYPPVRP